MSWLAKKELLLISIVLIFFSCKDNNQVGLSLPTGHALKASYDTNFPIYCTLLCDTVRTLSHSSGKILAGYYLDPVFGKVTAEAYVQLSLNTQQQIANPPYQSVDSVFLTLGFSENYQSPPDSQYVLNSTVGIPQNYGIHIYELKTQLDTTVTKYNLNYNLRIGSEELDSINPYPYNIDAGNSGFLKIYLKNSLGKRILNFIQAQGGALTPTFVATQLAGIAIIPDTRISSAIIPYSVGGSSGMSIYYTDSLGNPGNLFSLSFADTSFSTISSNRSGANFPLSALPNISLTSKRETLPTNTTASGPLYIQGGVGIKQELYIPSIIDFKKKNGNVLINNAYLYLPVIDSLYAPDYLFLYDTIGHALADGQIDYSTMSYNINMTSYLQDVIFGKTAFYGKLYLQPSWRLNNSTVKRVVIGSGIQLQVYYTK